MKRGVKHVLIFVILAAVLMSSCLVYVKNQPQETVNVSLEEWSSEYIEYTNGGWQIGADWLDIQGHTVTLLYGPYVDLPKGDYTVTIAYQCDVDQSFYVYAANSYEEYIQSNKVVLDNALNVMSYDFKVTEDIEGLEVVVYYNCQGDFSVSQINIERNNNALKRLFVYTVLLIIICMFWLYCKKHPNIKKEYILALLAIGFLSSLPLFFRGVNDAHGEDLMFHLMRIEGIVKELRLGNFPVRISSAWLGEHGYPVSVYYGDALLYLPAIFRLFGFTVNNAYKIFVFIINLFTAIIAERCFAPIVKKQKISLILALVYTTSSYRLLDVYARSAVGEYIALMFLPLIMLAIYRVYVDADYGLKRNFMNATILAIGMTGIITAHVLSAEMTAFAIGLVCICCIRKTLKWNVIRTYLIAIIETLLMSTAFLVPFLDYYSKESVVISYIVKNAFARRIQMMGSNIGYYFDFFSNPFTGTNRSQFNPGLILMLAFAAVVILWMKNKVTSEIKVCMVAASVLMVMSLNVFPWDTLSYNSKLFNMIAQVQFPWRFIGIATVILTLLLGLVLKDQYLENVFQLSRRLVWAVCIIVPVYTTFLFASYYADSAKNTMFYDTADLDTYFVGNGEYLRTGSDEYEIDGKIKTEGIVEHDLLARRGCELDIWCKTANSEGYVQLPVMNYTGYVVYDENGNSHEIVDGDNFCIGVKLPPNYEGTLYLRYEEPWYWSAALAVSAISIFGIVSYIGIDKYKKYRG